MGFIKALKLNAVVLVGHSMGGAVALHTAVHFPDKVLGLCLIGSGARLRVAPATLQSASDPSTIAEAIHLVIQGSFSPETNARLKELAAQRMQEVRPSVLYGDLLACNGFNVTGQLGQVRTPTFILCGTMDKMVPLKYSEFLRDNIPGAQMNVIPGAGHMLMLERPDLAAEKLGNFLDQVPFLPGL
jgi:pimeloyl-ACP methyl ester carboxylesterase